MLSRRDNFFDSPFDDFFGAPSRAPRGRGNGFLIPSFIDSRHFDRDLDSFGTSFGGFNENVEVKEKPDKYLIAVKGDNLDGAQYKLDYLRDLNSLVLQVTNDITHEDENSKSTSSSSFQRTIPFEKEIVVEDINAHSREHGLLIDVPKAESDAAEDSNRISIPITLHKESKRLK